MKTFLLILIFIVLSFVFIVPYNAKVLVFEKVWMDISILWEPKISEEEKEERIISLKFDDNRKSNYSGDLKKWEIMKDFSWANTQFVKCFDEKNYDDFNWKLKMHRILLGKKKDVKVKLTQTGGWWNLSMFVYKTEPLNKIFPPDITNVYDCDISTWEKNIKEIEMTGNTITSDIVIWIAWWTGTLDWTYDLELEEI